MRRNTVWNRVSDAIGLNGGESCLFFYYSAGGADSTSVLPSDRAVVIARRPVDGGQAQMCSERERVQLERVLGVGDGLFKTTLPEKFRSWRFSGVAAELPGAPEFLVALLPLPVETLQNLSEGSVRLRERVIELQRFARVCLRLRYHLARRQRTCVQKLGLRLPHRRIGFS